MIELAVNVSTPVAQEVVDAKTLLYFGTRVVHLEFSGCRFSYADVDPLLCAVDRYATADVAGGELGGKEWTCCSLGVGKLCKVFLRSGIPYSFKGLEQC